MPPVYTIELPEYSVATAPDAEGLGTPLDAFIAERFSGAIALRELSLADHPELTRTELIEIIQRVGTDRYDPERRGVLHDFYEPYGVELHALPCTITPNKKLISTHCEGSVIADCIVDFYEGPPVDRNGPPLRIDLILVYDRSVLEPVPVIYDSGPAEDPCEFRFRFPGRKVEALLGIVSLL